MVELGTLGGPESHAISLNNAGDVVGDADAAPGMRRAALWKGGSVAPIELNTRIAPGSGWTLTNASGINAAGQIVGTGVFGGVYRAYLLDPIPGT